MTRRRSPLLMCLLLVLVACLVPAAAGLAAPRSIRVVMDDNYPSFVFRDGSGRLQGILIDQWRLWERKTGVRAEISAMDWDEAQSRMRAGEFDVIDTLFETEARRAIYDFSKPYQKIDVPIFFDEQINGITDIASLKGFTVGAKKGDAAVEILRRQGITTLQLFNSYEAIIQAARQRKVTVFVIDRPPAFYFLHKYGVFERFRQSAVVSSGSFHRAVLKGNVELLKLVEDGFGRISAQELKHIETRWYGSTLPESRFLRHALAVAGGLTLLLLILFVWNRLLSAKVASRTAELNASLETVREHTRFVSTLMDAIPVPVFYKDREFRYLGCNRAFEEFYGASRDDIVGKGVFDVAPRELAEEYHARDMELLRQPGSQVYETQVKNARGELRDVVFHKATFSDAGGRVSGLVGAILDITERRNAETERLRLERQLLESRKMESLGVLAGGIAHDFNNLLQAILGHLDLALLRLPQESAARKNVCQAVEASTHAARLTGMMLAYTGKGILSIAEINLSRLVEENLDLLRASLSGGVGLDLRLDPALPAVRGDAGQLLQVIRNLVANADEAIAGGEGVITLTTGVREFDQSTLERSRLEEKLPAGRHAWLEVADNGSGMDEETQQKLFDPFFTTRFIGRGLGMSVVQGIIRAHRGALQVSSSPGAGTTMLVILPLAPRAGE